MIYTLDDLHLFYKPGDQISNKDGTRKVISFIPDMDDFNEKYRILNLKRLYYKKIQNMKLFLNMKFFICKHASVMQYSNMA